MLPPKSWEVVPCPDTGARDNLIRELGLSEFAAGYLVRRGVKTPEDAQPFLSPRLKDLMPPDGMADLTKGASRVADAIASRVRIGVFGDYDVDGLTSTSLMYLFLREASSAVEVRTADRFSGGYGLDIPVVEEFKKCGCEVLVVLDCGTSDHAAIQRAGELGIDVIVVDHHRVESAYPNAYAFINPQRSDCQFSDKSLAAVGLTFYFCAAVKKALLRIGYVSSDEIEMKHFLDLVALGTVADVVSLTGNNRILVTHGLRRMSESRRPGVEALVNSARIHTRFFTAAHISYQLAPRINAAGRLSTAMNAFELLVSTVDSDAMGYASILEQFSQERREIEANVSKAARKQALAQVAADARILLVGDSGWHKGVLGIVAARLSEEFSLPVFVVGFENGEGTGSARGTGNLNLYNCLESCSAVLQRFGGHRDAAGFSVDQPKMEELREGLSRYAEAHWVEVDRGPMACDATLNPSQLTRELLADVRRLGPFGCDNPEPIFDVMGLDVLSARVVGTSHLKLILKTPSGSVSAFGPGMGEYAGKLPPIINVVASVSADEWRGEDELELKLVSPPAACGESDLF